MHYILDPYQGTMNIFFFVWTSKLLWYCI